MAVRNVLILLHGLVSNRNGNIPTDLYDLFFKELEFRHPPLRRLNFVRINACWGRGTGENPPSPDSKLVRAQQYIATQVEYDNVRMHTDDPNNILMSGAFQDHGNPLIRGVSKQLREHVVQYGLSDIIYYSAPDGERALRTSVYGQILDSLTSLEADEEVRLHIVAHSLGVTIAHDFLFALFNSHKEPTFYNSTEREQSLRAALLGWRDHAQNGRLRLGTFVTMASQLPLFIMRKQSLVEALYQGEELDGTLIGLSPAYHRQWLNFYDIDDAMGFTTRQLYSPRESIAEIQVDTGSHPETAHMRYWENKTVIRESARTLYNNATRSPRQ